jgi:hypothetical protein
MHAEARSSPLPLYGDVRGRGLNDPFCLPREAVLGSWGPHCVLTLC